MKPYGKHVRHEGWHTDELHRLAQRIRQLEGGGWGEAERVHRAIETSWPGVDQALGLTLGGGLSRGAVHEWYGLDSSHESQTQAKTPQHWSPPLALLIHLAWCALEEPGESGDEERRERSGRLVLWIGRAIWPHPLALIRNQRSEFATGIAEIAEREISNLRFQISNQRFSSSARSACSTVNSSAVKLDRRLLAHSIFIDPPDDTSRMWAIDVALRSPAVAAVVADGRRIAMAESRRLQLAAEAGGRSRGGGGGIALLARASGELDQLSAAATRWRVRRTPSTTSAPRWIVELLRCKANPLSAINAQSGVQRWIMELDRATGRIACLADVVDRSDSTARAQDRTSTSRQRTSRSVRQSA